MGSYYSNLALKGASFAEFVWACARQFGALVGMRDAEPDAAIPLEWEPTAYYAEDIREYEAELARLRAMTPKQASLEVERRYQEQLEYAQKTNAERATAREKLRGIVREIQEWQPPTEKHEPLKEFMTQQIGYGESDLTDYPLPEKEDPEKWLKDEIARMERRLKTAQQRKQEDEEQEAVRTAWLKTLDASVPLPEKLKASSEIYPDTSKSHEFRFRPRVVSAQQYIPGAPLPANVDEHDGILTVLTSQGPVEVKPGQWVVQVDRDGFDNMVMSSSAFDAMFEKVE